MARISFSGPVDQKQIKICGNRLLFAINNSNKRCTSAYWSERMLVQLHQSELNFLENFFKLDCK